VVEAGLIIAGLVLPEAAGSDASCLFSMTVAKRVVVCHVGDESETHRWAWAAIVMVCPCLGIAVVEGEESLLGAEENCSP
jgi:hypothetical protein